MKAGMNLQKKSTIIVAGILFVIIAINTTVLTFVASQKYRLAILSKSTAVGENLQKELSKVLELGVPIESLEGVNEKLSELVSRDKSIGYAMLIAKDGKVFFHNDAVKAGNELQDEASLKAASSVKPLIQTLDAYYDLSFPLLDAVGKSPGAVRIGVELKAINSQVYVLLLWALGVSSLCFVLAIALVYGFISKFITKPIPPYNVANYPPLFVLIQVPFVWAVGPALWYGRLISLVSTLVAALFSGLTVWTLTRDRMASLAAGLLLLIFSYVLFWSQLNRIDNLALASLMAGLFVLTRNPNSSSGRILSAILITAAVFTRQSYLLAGPLAAFI